MIRTSQEYTVELRERMRGGEGTVQVAKLWQAPDELLNPAVRLCAVLTLKKGCSIGYHVHDREQEIFYVVSGTARADDNGTEKILHAGDSMLTGNGQGHAIANDGPADLVVAAAIVQF